MGLLETAEGSFYETNERNRKDIEIAALVSRGCIASCWRQLVLPGRSLAGLVRDLGRLRQRQLIIVPFQLGKAGARQA